MEDKIVNGKQIKNNTAEDVGLPIPKSDRRYGSIGIDKMSWEENQGSVKVRKHTTEDTTRKTTVENCKVFFKPGKKGAN